MSTKYTVRLLDSQGICQTSPLVVGDFGFMAGGRVPWAAVHDSEIPDDVFVGEISWFTPDEIRFFGAVSLAEPHPRSRGRIRIASRGRPATVTIPDADGEVSLTSLLERAKEVLPDLAGPTPDSRVPQTLSSKGRHSAIDRDYSLATEDLVRAMDTRDSLLHRGLYKFLMATELMAHPQFLEESAIAAFISREAALELLRRKLQSSSGGRPKKDDILAHIRDAFPTGDAFVGVLETDWEARVAMVHPSSRVGETWSPPVFAEECYDALHSLTYLYRFLLLDEVWEPIDGD